MKPTSLLKLVFLSLLIVSSSTVIHAQVTAIKVGRLLDPETGTVTANQIILVEGQTIKAIGPNIKVPNGASTIDLSNRTVLPGLFDAHTHLCMTTRRVRHAGNYFYTTLSDSNAYRAIQGVANARSMKLVSLPSSTAFQRPTKRF
jgi:imidazolonepropionase-like amidohydrolase